MPNKVVHVSMIVGKYVLFGTKKTIESSYIADIIKNIPNNTKAISVYGLDPSDIGLLAYEHKILPHDYNSNLVFHVRKDKKHTS
jgi:hypothetical protein